MREDQQRYTEGSFVPSDAVIHPVSPDKGGSHTRYRGNANQFGRCLPACARLEITLFSVLACIASKVLSTSPARWDATQISRTHALSLVTLQIAALCKPGSLTPIGTVLLRG